MTSHQKLLRRSLIGLGVATGMLFVLLLSTYALLQTQAGRGTLARFVAGQLSEGETTVAFGALEGDLFSEFTLRDIGVADTNGTWLTIDKATVAWHPLELLRGRLRVTRAVVSQTDITRRPVYQSDTGSVSFELPTAPLHIALEDFAVERIVLAEPVLGEAMTLGTKGTSSADLSGRLQTEIMLTRLDRNEDNARLKAAFDAASKQLSLEANVDSPQGGLIPRLLALPDLAGVSLSLSGAGPLDAWQVEYRARADSLAQIQGNATLRIAKQTRVELRGRLSAEQSAPDVLTTLARPALVFDTDLELAASDLLVVHRATLTSKLGNASLQGRLSREAVDLDVTLALEDTGSQRLAELTQPLSIEHAGLSAHVSGSLEQLQADLDVTLEGLSAPEAASVDRLTGRLSIALAEPLGSGALQPRVVGHGVLEGIRTSNAKLQPLLDEPVAWTTRGAAEPERRVLILEEVTAKTDAWQIAAGGRVAYTGDDVVDMDIELRLADLSRLEAVAQRPLAGKAQLSISVKSAAHDPTITATLAAETRDLVTSDKILDQVLGSNVALGAELQRDAQGTLTANTVTLKTTAATLTGDVRLPADMSTIDASYTVTVNRLDALSPLLGIAVSGSGTARGNLSGATLSPDLTGAVSLTQVEVDDFRIGAVSVDFALQELVRPHGSVKLSLEDIPQGPASIHTRLELTEGLTLWLRDLQAKAADATVGGELSVQLDSGLVDGRLTGRAEDLSTWSDIAGRGLTGKAAFETTLSSQADQQGLELAVDGSDITMRLDPERVLDIQKLTLSATLKDLLGTPRGPVSVSAQHAKVGELLVESVTAAGEVDGLGAEALTLRANGVLGEPFTADLSGAVNFASLDAYDIELGRLQASVFKQQIALVQPASLSVAPRHLVLRDLSLKVAGGQVDGSARVQQESVDVALKVEALPLTLVELVFPGAGVDGKVSGEATLEGTRANTNGAFNIELTGLRQIETLITDAPELSGRVAGEWRDRRLGLDGDLEGLADTKLTWQAQIPLQMKPQTLGFHVPLDEAITGKAHWNGAVAPLWRLLSHSENSLTGKGELSLTMGGTLGEPRVDGRVTLADGRYENIAAGTLFEQITVVAKGNNDRLVLTQASASDGVGGTVEAQGEVLLNVTKHFPVDMRLELSNAMLIQRDDLTATASGQLTFSGSTEDAELAGNIVTQRVDAHLGTNLPPQVVDLQVVEVNHPEDRARSTNSTPAIGPDFIRLALDIELPGKVFVRGLGIDSEWKGDLRVRGKADKPIIKGLLQPVRGRYSFAGKVFDLENGSVRFTGSRPIDPLLNLPAEYKTSGVTAIIAVTGRASNPVVELTSRPPMPESEIASRVIFGTEQSKLSPLQTIQLADAVAALTGGGVGVLEHARRSVGVDVLKLGSDDNNDGDPTVSVGKYVTDKVYVEVEQGATPGSTGGTVEVEVLPNISVNSGRTQDGNNKVGLKWKWDY